MRGCPEITVALLLRIYYSMIPFSAFSHLTNHLHRLGKQDPQRLLSIRAVLRRGLQRIACGALRGFSIKVVNAAEAFLSCARGKNIVSITGAKGSPGDSSGFQHG